MNNQQPQVKSGSEGDFPEPQHRLSIFELGGKQFGMDISSIREVVPLPGFTPLPNSNEVYLGVFNLRGEIFPIVDISTILGLAPKEVWSDDMVILIEHEEIVIGALVDKIYSMSTYTPSGVKLPREIIPQAILPFVKGVVEKNNQLVYILDAAQLLRHEKILEHYY